MKILHIIPTYWPAFSRGGPIWSVHLLNKWLVKKGVDVTVYTTDLGINIGTSDVLRTSDVQNIDGVKVRYFPVTWSRWEYSRKMHKAFAKNIKEFDLVHITSVFLSASTLGAHYAKKFNKPYIISPRGALMKEPIEKKSSLLKKLYIVAVEEKNLAEASAVHFTTELEREEYVDLGLPVKKSVVIPNGLDFPAVTRHSTNFRERFGVPRDAKIVLILGRISWKKGFDTLIPAFAEVVKKEPKAVLVIAGGDEENYQKVIELLVISHKLKDNVFFTGQLLGEDKAAAYQAADVFVLPSYAENFAMVAVEAMYNKLPVVVTEGVGIATDIEKAGAGIVVKKDAREVADAILEVLKNPAEAKKMGENGRQLVEDKFSIEKVAKEWVRAYEGLLDKSLP